jgi:hypothetical protein
MPANNAYVEDVLEANGTLIIQTASENRAVKQVVKTIDVAAADTDGCIYRLFPIASTARILAIHLSCTAITAGTDYDIGVYETRKNGGAVNSKDCLLDGQTMATALRNADALLKPTVANLNKTLWEMAGLSADPVRDIDIAITANTVGTAAGTIVVRVVYQ